MKNKPNTKLIDKLEEEIMSYLPLTAFPPLQSPIALNPNTNPCIQSVPTKYPTITARASVKTGTNLVGNPTPFAACTNPITNGTNNTSDESILFYFF